VRRPILAALACVASLTFSTAGPALAGDGDGPSVQRWSADELAAATQPGTRAQRPERVDTFLDLEARQGRYRDKAQVREATVESADGGLITVVHGTDSRPESLAVATQAFDSGSEVQTEFAGEFAETDTGPAPATGGFGYGGGLNPQGMYKYNGGCRTVFFEPLYAHKDDHWTTTCYEKWAQSGTRNWIYNRWGWFTRGTPSARYAYVIDYEIRSRPWKGYESRVTQLFDHTPAPSSSSSCSNTANWSLKIGPVGITIPGHRCNGSFVVFPNANVRSGGVDWGNQKLGQVFLDFGIAIQASNTSTVPLYADYTYAVVCDGLTAATCTSNRQQALKLTDSGW
jgi:hypothetical protein